MVLTEIYLGVVALLMEGKKLSPPAGFRPLTPPSKDTFKTFLREFRASCVLEDDPLEPGRLEGDNIEPK